MTVAEIMEAVKELKVMELSEPVSYTHLAAAIVFGCLFALLAKPKSKS